jgi:hypothetical protein
MDSDPNLARARNRVRNLHHPQHPEAAKPADHNRTHCEISLVTKNG